MQTIQRLEELAATLGSNAAFDDLLLLTAADCAGRPPLPPAVTDRLIPLARCIT